MQHSYKEQAVTPELLDTLKRKAMLMEDELAIEGGRQFERTGRLNDPGLCEMSIEYENLRMDIDTLEGVLRQIEEKQGSSEEQPRSHK
ncbi:MAG: hypothetical protein PUD73_03980 [bacterium]|nr:hypothetical protein [bacterium]